MGNEETNKKTENNTFKGDGTTSPYYLDKTKLALRRWLEKQITEWNCAYFMKIWIVNIK